MIALAVVALVPETAVAAQQSAPPLNSYGHRLWTDADGLPLNTVNCLEQTRDGFLWVGTAEGLARFDGRRFTVFDTSNTPALHNNMVWSLHEGRDGSLWVGTISGLTRMKDGAWSHYSVADGLLHNTVRALDEDAAGTLWIGTSGGLNALAPDGTLTAINPDEGDAITDIQALRTGADGSVWLGTRARGLARYHDGRFTRYGTHEDVSTLWTDPDNVLWAATRGGLVRLENGDFTIFTSRDGLAQNAVNQVYRDTAGTLWVATTEGFLHRFDGAGGFEIRQPPFGELIRALASDHEGGLWVGTNGAGLSRLYVSPVEMVDVDRGLSNDVVWDIGEDRAGQVWIGTAEGLNRFDPVQHRIVETPGIFSNDHIGGIFADSQGRFWIGTRRGVWMRENGHWTNYTTADGLADNRAHSMREDYHGRVWIATSRGLNVFEDGTIHAVNAAGAPPPTLINALFISSDGSLWAGTNQGIFRRDPDDGWSTGDIEQELSQNSILDFHEDSAGSLWIGTHGNGLKRLRDDRIDTVRSADGLCDDVVFRIIEDASGDFWLSSNRGICRVARAQLEAFLDGETSTVPAVAYGAVDGMNTSETNGGAGLLGSDGRVWFGTPHGAVAVDPRRLNPVPPPVMIESINLGEGWHPARSGLRVPGDSRELRIRFTATSFQVPEKVRFRYRLAGRDDGWIEAEGRREVNYAGIAPGHYVFHVRAANNDGVWNDTGASFEFTVVPLFYQTWTFYGLCAALLVAIGLLAGQWRRRELERRRQALEIQVTERTRDLEQALAKVAEQADALHELDRAKSRFFANISHEFRTPLTVILGGLRDSLEGRFGKLSAELENQHHAMLRNTRRLQRLIEQILDLNRLESGRLELEPAPGCVAEFLRDLTNAQAPLAERNGINLRLECGTNPCPRLFDPDKLEKIVGNILANALKFTPRGGTVCVTLSADSAPPLRLRRGDKGDAERQRGPSPEDWITISVTDNGPGIPLAAQQRIFERFYRADEGASREGTGIGLALAYELARLHGGDLELDSTPGEGSTFNVILPLEKTGIPDKSIAAKAAPTVLAEAPCRSAGSGGRAVFAFRRKKPFRSAVARGFSREKESETAPDQTTILIIEDHDDVRAYVRRVLAPDYRVLEAEDGKSGLGQAREALPDLIVSDIMLPGADGFEIARELKADAATECIPVIMLTARAADGDQAEGYGSGAEAYLIKPFSPDTLRAAVARLLAERRRLREKLAGAAVMPPPDLERAALIARARAVIIEHLYDENFGVDELAAGLAMSRSRLYRELRKEAGDSPAALIRSIRLERARDLLSNGAGSVSEVAYAVGFKSLSHFTRSFQIHFDQAPSSYL